MQNFDLNKQSQTQKKVLKYSKLFLTNYQRDSDLQNSHKSHFLTWRIFEETIVKLRLVNECPIQENWKKIPVNLEDA